MTRRELRYVSCLELCPLAITLCLLWRKKKVTFFCRKGERRKQYIAMVLGVTIGREEHFLRA